MNQTEEIILNDALQKVNSIMFRELENQPSLLQQAVKPLLTAKGKMVRPLLLLNSVAACGGKWIDSLNLAAALEYLHLATIIHDDFIDGSGTRRGNQTIHRRWDQGVAVLAGDFCFSRSLILAAPYGVSFTVGIGDLVKSLVKGEFLQKQEQYDFSRTEAQYWECIYYKTAVFFQQTCFLGALLAGGGNNLQNLMYGYGTHLGLAYQLKDDLLDLLPSECLGKDKFKDLPNGIYNLPVIHALRNGVTPQYFQEALDSNDREAVLVLLEKAGSLQYAAKWLEMLTHKALGYISRLPAGEARGQLEVFALEAARRAF